MRWRGQLTFMQSVNCNCVVLSSMETESLLDLKDILRPTVFQEVGPEVFARKWPKIVDFSTVLPTEWDIGNAAIDVTCFAADLSWVSWKIYYTILIFLSKIFWRFLKLGLLNIFSTMSKTVNITTSHALFVSCPAHSLNLNAGIAWT